MDPLLWLAAAAIVAVVLCSIPYFQSLLLGRTTDNNEERNVPRVPPDQPLVVGGARRARGRVRQRIQQQEEEEVSDEDVELPAMPTGKIGAKKMRKLQAKAERKAQREQEEAYREDMKKREALREEEQKKEEEAEAKRIAKQKEKEKRQLEEQKKKEEEEYLKLKETFTIEEEGHIDESESQKGIQDFIDYIKEQKVVFLEDLAAEFSMRTKDVISRIQSLQESGDLTGVVDDRGKFIYVSLQELKAVAKFIKQRGRVSISDLVTSSNTLINLQSGTS